MLPPGRQDIPRMRAASGRRRRASRAPSGRNGRRGPGRIDTVPAAGQNSIVMKSWRIAPLLAQAPGAAAQAPPDTGSPLRSSPLAWVAAGILLIAAVYFLIRLLEWDLMNEETPNQEDPLLR